MQVCLHETWPTWRVMAESFPMNALQVQDMLRQAQRSPCPHYTYFQWLTKIISYLWFPRNTLLWLWNNVLSIRLHAIVAFATRCQKTRQTPIMPATVEPRPSQRRSVFQPQRPSAHASHQVPESSRGHDPSDWLEPAEYLWLGDSDLGDPETLGVYCNIMQYIYI